MPALTFNDQFADAVRSGLKNQTIRRPGTNGYRVGQRLKLVRWIGVAYRSPQETLRETTIKEVLNVEISAGGSLTVDGKRIDGDAADTFARQDGFASLSQMVDWFRHQYGLPFRGQCIRW